MRQNSAWSVVHRRRSMDTRVNLQWSRSNGPEKQLDVRVSDVLELGREITLEMIEAAPSYEDRANLVRAFVRQDSARAALVVRQLMQEGAHG